MFTKSDINQLKEVFATKKDLEKFVTKSEFTAAFDALMHELKAIREELIVSSYRGSENYDAIQNHDGRITLMESKLSF